MLRRWSLNVLWRCSIILLRMLLLISQGFRGLYSKNACSFGYSICYIDTTWIFPWTFKLVGSGSAILAVVLAVNPTMPVAFLFPLFATTRIARQHLDITQSWVAWGLGYTKVSSREYMKKSIPTGWIIGAIVCMITFLLYGNFSHCDNRNEMEE